MCERPAEINERASCPLCGEESTLKLLEVHVASHLEDIALFVLPKQADDEETDADLNHAGKPARKDERLDDDQSSSLGSLLGNLRVTESDESTRS